VFSMVRRLMFLHSTECLISCLILQVGEAGIKHYMQKMSGLAKRRQSSAENPSGDSDSGADGYPYSLRKASVCLCCFRSCFRE
jgi:hypothetical protein